MTDTTEVHDDEPDGPTELTASSWKYVAGRTVREFSRDGCTDLAAALTYYAVLALFPAAIALVSILGLVGDSRSMVDSLLDIVRDIGPASAADNIEPTLQQLTETSGAGLALVVGLAGALWSASAYVGAFGRATNRIYGRREGRPFWMLRPIMLVVTLVAVLLVAIAVVILVLSGPVARSVGDVLGLGDTAVTAWNIAKWPVLAAVVVTVVALLYGATPNVRQTKFRWLSVGACVAIVVWVVASVGFAVYVTNFSSYDRTYGSLAAAIVFLLWLWITNIALLFGVELDAELQRARELQGGVRAEEEVQLKAWDTRASDKAEAKLADDVRAGQRLRESGGSHREQPGDES